ncbi:glycosyltransferase family 2 protein [Geoglobus acetivorans]|uniref:Glycosyl transferase n=1 Tax=Geoglobus acetivorans TaxID=565033 RepID=A0A0A7GCH9_GEOAI|nr:Glycosyl transferase [Geoglobus acetivorans]
MTSEPSSVSIVIPTHNRKDKLIRLIESILQSNYPKEKLEIIVVDDASTDGTYEELTKIFSDLIKERKLKIIRNKRDRYSTYCRNIGVKYSHGEYIFLIDDDNIVDKSCILELVKTFKQNDKIGMVCPLNLWKKEPDVIIAIGGKIPILWRRLFSRDKYKKLIGKRINFVNLPDTIENCDFCPNAFMIKKDLALKTLPDSDLFPHNWGEVEWGVKVKQLGYEIICNTKAIVWHDINNPYRIITRIDNEFKAYDIAKTRIIFVRKYGVVIDKILLFITLLLYIVGYIIIALKSSRSRSKRTIIGAILEGTTHGLFYDFNNLKR